MKYLENIELEMMNSYLTDRPFGGRILNGRVEVYSTKKAGGDKKQWKLLEQKVESNSPRGGGSESLPKSSIRVLVDLIQTLNASLMDYDFSELNSESFLLLSSTDAISRINTQLAELTVENPSFLKTLWGHIDRHINCAKCEVYLLIDDPFIIDSEGGVMWSFNYFFCNKELKRICYFTCSATTKSYSNLLSMTGAESDLDNDDSDLEEGRCSDNDEMDESMEDF